MSQSVPPWEIGARWTCFVLDWVLEKLDWDYSVNTRNQTSPTSKASTGPLGKRSHTSFGYVAVGGSISASSLALSQSASPQPLNKIDPSVAPDSLLANLPLSLRTLLSQIQSHIHRWAARFPLRQVTQKEDPKEWLKRVRFQARQGIEGLELLQQAVRKLGELWRDQCGGFDPATKNRMPGSVQLMKELLETAMEAEKLVQKCCDAITLLESFCTTALAGSDQAAIDNAVCEWMSACRWPASGEKWLITWMEFSDVQQQQMVSKKSLQSIWMRPKRDPNSRLRKPKPNLQDMDIPSAEASPLANALLPPNIPEPGEPRMQMSRMASYPQANERQFGNVKDDLLLLREIGIRCHLVSNDDTDVRLLRVSNQIPFITLREMIRKRYKFPTNQFQIEVKSLDGKAEIIDSDIQLSAAINKALPHNQIIQINIYRPQQHLSSPIKAQRGQSKDLQAQTMSTDSPQTSFLPSIHLPPANTQVGDYLQIPPSSIPDSPPNQQQGKRILPSIGSPVQPNPPKPTLGVGPSHRHRDIFVNQAPSYGRRMPNPLPHMTPPTTPYYDENTSTSLDDHTMRLVSLYYTENATE